MEVDSVTNTDPEQRMILLNESIDTLKNDNKKLHDEFNVQRAKMRELFLQKEKEFKNEQTKLITDIEQLKQELDDARSQVLIAGFKSETDLEDEKRKAQEEIASLQQLVHETVEESSSSRTQYDLELKKLQTRIQQLQDENKELKLLAHHHQLSPHHNLQQESSSLAPSVVLSAVTKTLRKLGSDTFSTQENLEESMRKAQEDAEMLRSLVVPLEDEIKALKDKLRYTDEQLQKCRQCGHNTDNNSLLLLQNSEEDTNDGLVNDETSIFEDNDGTSPNKESPTPNCDMCTNYELQLVSEQKRNSELESRLLAAEKSMDRHKEELLKEIGFRKQMEEKWNEKKEEHKQQVSKLSEQTLNGEQELRELSRTFETYRTGVLEQLALVSRECEQIKHYHIHLQAENEKLVGKYQEHSQRLQSETINLPDTIEELQEKVLGLQEKLIVVTIGKEEAEEQQNKLEEITLLKCEQTENELKDNLKQLSLEKEKLHSVEEKYRQMEVAYQKQLQKIKDLEESSSELRIQISSLQHELSTTVTVQQDFVRLSQSLQVQLEKIRDADAQVRWQHEDDTDECPTCRHIFSGGGGVTAKKKQHCMHCGQVFCTQCLSHAVPSGPKQRPARVCDVCHTLLVKSSAPYFSNEPPHTPD